MNTYDSTRETLGHIAEVQGYLSLIADKLYIRGLDHDASKLQSPEKELFDEWTPKLKELVYGSDEYKAALVEMGPALRHHYQKNNHHPEWEKANKEEWLPVVGFEDIYEISNLGEIRSVNRLIPRPGITGDINRSGQLMTPHVTPKGYLRLQLSKNGTHANRMVHILVAEAFVPNPDGKPQVNHKDGHKQNNRYWNLEWCTPSENLQHAYDNGLKKPVAKYIVECKELGIVTRGCNRMEEELKRRGYDTAQAAGIWLCIHGDNATHLGLTFEGEKIEEPRPYSGVDGMSLLDVIELLCDWRAAAKSDGDFQESIKINCQRFGIDPQLGLILANTARELGWTK